MIHHTGTGLIILAMLLLLNNAIAVVAGQMLLASHFIMPGIFFIIGLLMRRPKA